jgi:hypothetical protein
MAFALASLKSEPGVHVIYSVYGGPCSSSVSVVSTSASVVSASFEHAAKNNTEKSTKNFK